MKTIWILLIALMMYGCQTPYSGTLGPDDFKGWIESEENEFICLWNGFDRICIQTIPGPPGKDGRDGKDGKDGRDGVSTTGEPGEDGTSYLLVQRTYALTNSDTGETREHEVVVHVPIPEPESEPEPLTGEDIAELERSVIEPTSLPTKMSCGGQTCHVESRADGYHVITESESGEIFDDGSWILDEAGYQGWLNLLESLTQD